MSETLNKEDEMREIIIGLIGTSDPHELRGLALHLPLMILNVHGAERENLKARERAVLFLLEELQ